MLRFADANAIINAVSFPIMAAAEMSALKKIATQERIQVLANGTSHKIPGTQFQVPNSGPLMLQAMKNLYSPKGKALLQKYEDAGIITSLLTDMKAAEGNFARIAGESDISKVNTTVDDVIKVLSKPAEWSEQLVKFMAANMADMAMETLQIPAAMRKTTMNLFVTRVHGNYIASQRPTLFQGWIGQTVGLFQTYQFNMLQSIFGNVARGNGQAVAKMMGLQAGIFGAQSVPGFQLVNEYIGNRSAENNDFYKVTGELVGDDLSNFLLYGAASSATVPILGDGIDLYSRGDLNPRTPILIPTSPSEVPLVNITGNFLGGVLNAVGKMQNGAPVVASMLDALGHNGFNRPLQGVAQLIAGERTTGSSSLIASYHGWDVWNGITKVIGTKTLSEAVATGSYYRAVAYQAEDSKQLAELGEAYRQTVMAGTEDRQTYLDFAERYAAKGGNIERFGGWVVRNHKNATESQINQLRDNNNSPQGRYLQQVMGAEIEDLTTDGTGF
jgi:hypothetical protein